MSSEPEKFGARITQFQRVGERASGGIVEVNRYSPKHGVKLARAVQEKKGATRPVAPPR